jgi:hypothetical protein
VDQLEMGICWNAGKLGSKLVLKNGGSPDCLEAINVAFPQIPEWSGAFIPSLRDRRGDHFRSWLFLSLTMDRGNSSFGS